MWVVLESSSQKHILYFFYFSFSLDDLLGIPAARFKHLEPSDRNGGCYNTQYFINELYLKYVALFGCPHTFGPVVYAKSN